MALATAIFRHRRTLFFVVLASLLVFLSELLYLYRLRSFSTGPLLGTLVLLPPLVLWYAMLGLWYAAWFREGGAGAIADREAAGVRWLCPRFLADLAEHARDGGARPLAGLTGASRWMVWRFVRSRCSYTTCPPRFPPNASC